MSLDEATLTQYALGLLDEKEQQSIQKQIAKSSDLQTELATIRESLQCIAMAEEPQPSSDNRRNRILASIHKTTRFEGFIMRFAQLFDLDTTTSQNLLQKIDDSSDPAWESTPFPGVTIMKFPGGSKVSEATCGIVQVQPGKLFPAHQHQGGESNLILQGQALDDKGKTLRAGDVFHLSAGSQHSFRITGDENFIFAVVLQKDNRWLLVKTLLDLFRIKQG